MPRERTKARDGEWGRRQWIHLGLLLAGFGVFGLCTGTVLRPQLDQYADRRGLGGRIASWFVQPYIIAHASYDHRFRYVRRSHNGFVDITDLPQSQLAEICEASKAGSKDVWAIVLGGASREEGYWAVVSSVNRVTLGISLQHDAPRPNAGGPISADEATEIRRVALIKAKDYLDKYFPTCDAEALARTGILVWVDPIVSGYLLNAGTVGGLVLVVGCTPFVVRDVLRAVAFGMRHRANKCTTCGYDLRGLAGTVCPECGAPVSLSPHPVEQ